MEIFELRYFLEVARRQNVHRASEALGVSPGSLSKAVARLETELGVKLFARHGRNIRLTDAGVLLRQRAAQIAELEAAARLEVGGAALRARIAGPEVLLPRFGRELAARIRGRYANACFEFRAGSEEETAAWVRDGEAHFGILTGDVPAGATAKVLESASFVTVAGPGHPLYRRARAGAVIPVEEVLRHGFAGASRPLLGSVGRRQSVDGWRDDAFPRRIDWLCSTVKLLEAMVLSGDALAYLPDYLARDTQMAVLKISGCPYTCTQKIRVVTRVPIELGWVRQVW